jgi:protein O-GlcNAcase/histone acetyltransferase
LLFDDIPDRLDPEDIKRWGALAPAQCHVANGVFEWVRRHHAHARFLFCPTAYCGRMAALRVGGQDYLRVIGRELLPEIDVFWTGPEIVSRQITAAHIREVGSWLGRKPLIWDNLHANDYDGRRFYCGPYSGRPAELKGVVSGLLCNPNNEFPLNYIPLRTLAGFMRAEGEWDARGAYLSALKEWLPRFATAAGGAVTAEELTMFLDCHYLPYEEGAEAEALYRQVAAVLAGKPENRTELGEAFRREGRRLRDLCGKLAQLKDRPLFYAMSRRIWDLREELDLLERYVGWTSGRPDPGAGWSSDFHLPGTYRGGFVARLQGLLTQQPDGTFTVAANVANRSGPL